MDKSSDQYVCSRYLSGENQRVIGKTLNVSFQRIQQILKRNNISYKDSSRFKEAQLKKEAHKKYMSDKHVSGYGCSRKRWEYYRGFCENYRETPLYKYREQKKNASKRGITWCMSMDEWWDIWLISGKWKHRGRCLGEYVMARFEDKGDYSSDNVYITSCSNNIIDGYEFRKGKKTLLAITAERG